MNSVANHRCSVRLKGYDYSQAGAYFVTACERQGMCAWRDFKRRNEVEQVWEYHTCMLERFAEPLSTDSIGFICHHAQPRTWNNYVDHRQCRGGSRTARKKDNS